MLASGIWNRPLGPARPRPRCAPAPTASVLFFGLQTIEWAARERLGLP